MKKIHLFIFLVLIPASLFSQQGIPFVTNFSPETYDGESQIWDITQGKDGKMYFGGNEGVYVFDGAHWQTLKINEQNAQVIRAIGIKGNRIYIGSSNEFGFFEPKKNGKWEYISLSSRLDSAHNDFTDVWTLETTNDRVYFATRNYIFSYSPAEDTIRIIESGDSRFFMLQKVRGECYIYKFNQGFVKVVKDTIEALPYGKSFSWSLLPYDTDKILGLSSQYGLQIYGKDTILNPELFFSKKAIKQTNSFLYNNLLYSAEALNSGDFALGTIRSGVAIMDAKGNIKYVLTRKKGIINNTIQYLYQDKQHNLWAGTAYGISKLSVQFPVEIFDENMGVDGAIYNILRTRNKFYLATNLGLFYFKDGKFEPIPRLTGENAQQVFTLYKFKFPDYDKEVILGTATEGIFMLKDTSVEILANEFGYFLDQSPVDSNQILFTRDFALMAAEFKKGKYTGEKVIKKFDFPVNMIFTDDNYIWLENSKTGSFFLYDISMNQILDLDKIIPDTIELHSEIKVNDQLILSTNHGLYTLDYGSMDFEPLDNALSKAFGDKEILLIDTINPNYWIVTVKDEKIKHNLVKLHENKVIIDSLSLSLLNEAETVVPDGDSILWFWSTDKLYKYKLKNNFDYKPKSKVIITQITINEDSVVYSGAGDIPPLTLDYEYNTVTIKYALPDFLDNQKNTYSYFLEGNHVKKKNRKWSPWTTNTQKEFSNLHEGKYTLRIKARNAFGVEAKEAVIKFEVLPPWHRTIWAYAGYIILLSLFIYLIVKINQRRLKKENERLEQIIRQRTAEIMQQKEEIQTQAENLKEINALLIEKNEEIQQQNEEIRTIAESLKQANDKITHQNKRITDSINYASRIQEAIFSRQAEMRNYFPEHFLLYKPKEIVSGDFYWFKRIDNYLIVAVADCTGHGVPGAFMSMLSYAYLTEIATSRKISSASKALDTLRDLIIQSLNREEQKAGDIQRDGLDIAFCAIDMETKLMQFAGAHNPAVIIRKNKLYELKGDNMPVGYFRKMRPFTQKEIQLNDGDKIYLFSDGYFDQFDKTKSRKFYRRNFFNLILSISDKPMQEQKNILNEEFEQWKGYEAEQTDDVLVLGFEINFGIIDEQKEKNE